MNQAASHPAVALLSEMLDIPSPPSRESETARWIVQKVASWGYQTERDAIGNVSVRLTGRNDNASPVVIAAHVDEIALVVTGIDRDGRLRVERSGAMDPYRTGDRPMTVLGDGEPVRGVLCLDYMQPRPAGGMEAHDWRHYRIFTGLSPEQLARAGVRIGSMAVPAREGRGPILLGDPDDPFLAAWTMDDRMGVVSLLRMLHALRERQMQLERPCVVAFTTQEEDGCHGARFLAMRERPEIFLAVDGCFVTPDMPLALDGRPGVWCRDSKGNYDCRLVQFLMQTARAAGTELQPAAYPKASSDASAVLQSGAAPRTAMFGHVRANNHGFEIARLSVFDNVLATLLAFVSHLPQ